MMPTGDEGLPADRAALTRVAREWMGLWQGRSLERFDSIHPSTFVDRSPDGRAPDRDAFRGGIRSLYAAFPDFKAEVRMMAIDEAAGLVTIGWSACARMEREFMGLAPTGASFAFSGIEVIRIRDAQIVERWGEWNGDSILRQIGQPTGL